MCSSVCLAVLQPRALCSRLYPLCIPAFRAWRQCAHMIALILDCVLVFSLWNLPRSNRQR
ncbi:hypothetical protein BD309DRAFT_960365 [Dichomitus squalens]|nr:hypothetical protein BD309DRAFT_960365 [Dichomitus squalens]